MLAALLVPRVVCIGPVNHRHRRVDLGDARLHLLEQLLLQLLGRSEYLLGVGVLLNQMLADVRTQNLGLAEHLM